MKANPEHPHSFRSLRSSTIHATDGEIGSVDDLLFDDRNWTVRHVVVDTGTWLPGRKVLVPRNLLAEHDDDGDTLHVDLTVSEVREAPGIEDDPPRSRQNSLVFMDFYWLAFPWGGFIGAPTSAASPPPVDPKQATPEEREALHLRSADEVQGYRVQASDRSLGHIQDFVVDCRTWRISHVVVDTRNWLPGRHVVVEVDVIAGMDAGERQVDIRLTADEIRARPEIAIRDGEVDPASLPGPKR